MDSTGARGSQHQRVRPLQGRRRRAGHPLHPRQGAGPRPHTPRHHARVAEHVRRDAQDHPVAVRPRKSRRRRDRLLRRHRPVHARIRLLGPAHTARNEPHPHRRAVALTDDRGPWIRPLRRSGRRLGSTNHHDPWAELPSDGERDPPDNGRWRLPNSAEDQLSDAEKEFLAHREWWQQAEGAYGHQQRTKPQTLSYGLNDSPAGLAGWIVEKWRTWSDCGGDVESRFSKDELLTHLTVYWAAQTISSSVRLYYESGRDPSHLTSDNQVTVPTSFAKFPVEISYPPREWVERFYNLARYTEMPSGGHFAAAEEPQLLAEDIRASFRSLR